MKWQPIETAPKKGVVMLASACGKIGHGWWDDPASEYEGWITHTLEQWPEALPKPITYWMPLPSPPAPKSSRLFKGKVEYGDLIFAGAGRAFFDPELQIAQTEPMLPNANGEFSFYYDASAQLHVEVRRRNPIKQSYDTVSIKTISELDGDKDATQTACKP